MEVWESIEKEKCSCLDCIWCKFKKGWLDIKTGEISKKAKFTCDAGNWDERLIKYWAKRSSNQLQTILSPARRNLKIFTACSLFEDGRE
jgi:hypothetical protein